MTWLPEELFGAGPESVAANVVATPLSYGLVCTKLVEDKCAIYERRPSKCRAFPFQPEQPAEWIGKLLADFRENAERDGLKCDFDPAAPIIWRNDQAVVGESAATFVDVRRRFQESQAVCQTLIDRLLRDEPAVIRAAATTGAHRELPYSLVLRAMDHLGVVSASDVRRHAHNQHTLAQTMVSEALERQLPSERGMTHLIRLIVRNYQRSGLLA